MCGRYSLTASEIAEIFEVDVLPEILPRSNIAPSEEVPVIVQSDGIRSAAMFRWGLIPFWAKDRKIAYKTINARGETVESKPAFRSSFKKKRCLIVADGFYEWKRLSKTEKIPHLMRVDGGKPFAMAGVWAKWTDPESGEEVTSCSIVTTGPNELMEPIHDRMPVILPKEHWGRWLDPENQDTAALKELLVPFDAARMGARAVSSYVNNARHQGAECQEDFELAHGRLGGGTGSDIEPHGSPPRQISLGAPAGGESAAALLRPPERVQREQGLSGPRCPPRSPALCLMTSTPPPSRPAEPKHRASTEAKARCRSPRSRGRGTWV